MLPGVPAGVLTGPNLAREVAAGPSGGLRGRAARRGPGRAGCRSWCTRGTFRAYTGTDVVGCEIAGATKNVMAIAAGHRRRARAWATTPGPCSSPGAWPSWAASASPLGGKVLTFGGLAGVGDLVATCASPKSRNRTVGFALGEGRSLDEIVSGMHMVAEGVKSAGPLVGLARAHGVEMPIAEQVAGDRRGPLLARRRRS